MSDAPENEPAEDANHRGMREALAKKKAATHASAGGPGGAQHLKGSNEKVQRQFRRKSG